MKLKSRYYESVRTTALEHEGKTYLYVESGYDGGDQTTKAFEAPGIEVKDESILALIEDALNNEADDFLDECDEE